MLKFKTTDVHRLIPTEMVNNDRSSQTPRQRNGTTGHQVFGPVHILPQIGRLLSVLFISVLFSLYRKDVAATAEQASGTMC